MSAIDLDVRVDEAALGGLSASLQGELVGPGSPAYDEHRRVWNGSIDRFPADGGAPCYAGTARSRSVLERQEPPKMRGAFLRADDGTRTHDLLHGKQTL